MATLEEILAVKHGDIFHENHEPGGKIYRWRVNGKVKTWKTRPGEFRIPVKYGLRSYDYITQDTLHRVHLASECPDNKPGPSSAVLDDQGMFP